LNRFGNVPKHLRDALREDALNTIKTLLPEDFAHFLEFQAVDGREPVAITETLTLLRVTATLESEKNIPLDLVFPDWPDLVDGSAVQPGRFLLPTFRLAVGVHLSDGPLAERLETSLRTYLDCDAERIVSIYTDGVRQLADDMGKSMERIPSFQQADIPSLSMRWARKICSVDRHSVESEALRGNPWAPICERVMRQLDDLKNENG
jgi:hypothetical protein